jgi:hypothetical protein
MALSIIKPPGSPGNRQNYLFSAPGFVVGSRPPRATETRASTDSGRTIGLSRIPDHHGVSSSWRGSNPAIHVASPQRRLRYRRGQSLSRQNEKGERLARRAPSTLETAVPRSNRTYGLRDTPQSRGPRSRAASSPKSRVPGRRRLGRCRCPD